MYTTLVLWILGFTLPVSPCQPLIKQPDHLEVSIMLDLKSDAYEILKVKCNGCHQIKNPAWVFTLDNMTIFSEEINKQVFIKKRMPKGKEIKLTQEEYQRLRNWLTQSDSN